MFCLSSKISKRILNVGSGVNNKQYMSVRGTDLDLSSKQTLVEIKHV